MMSENSIPRATMINFIRGKLGNQKISSEFTDLMIGLAQEYLHVLTAQSNQICQQEGKKTISVQHFYKAMKELGMEKVIRRLKEAEEIRKKKEQIKKEKKQKIGENIRKHNETENYECVKLSFKLQNKSELKPLQLEEEVDFSEYVEDQKSKAEN